MKIQKDKLFKRSMLISKEEKTINSIIGAAVKVEGDFVAKGDIVVEGIVNGSLKTEKFLKVGQDAKITADIEAGSAFIAGKIEGNVKVKEKLELTGSASVKGDIEVNVLSIASGAVLNGNCRMSGAKEESIKEKVE